MLPSVTLCHLFFFSICRVLFVPSLFNSSMLLTFFPLFALPHLLYFSVPFSPPSPSCTSPPSSVSFLLSLSFFCASPDPPPPSAHVDMSTVAFDVDPLDLDAEELPESQGDPRSPKGMSGSVTSPQANTHRLPFFKKVTLGAQDTSAPSCVCSSLLQHVVRSIVSFLFPSAVSH